MIESLLGVRGNVLPLGRGLLRLFFGLPRAGFERDPGEVCGVRGASHGDAQFMGLYVCDTCAVKSWELDMVGCCQNRLREQLAARAQVVRQRDVFFPGLDIRRCLSLGSQKVPA